MSPSIILAARGRITTHFGEDIGRGFPHRGIDQGHGDGNAVDLEIRAPADGVVTAHGWFGSYGNRLVLKHSDGWTSLLAHHASQGVKTGDTVGQGQLIAVMGNTGTVYVHNHQELRLADGSQVDPLLHLSATAGGSLTPLETDMPLNDDDKAWLNTMGASIIDQLQRTVGGAVWGEDLAYANGVHGRSKDWLMNMSVQVGAILEKPSSIIDPAKLAAALVAAGLNVTIDSAALVNALDASLSDNFAAIPAAVRNAIIK